MRLSRGMQSRVDEDWGYEWDEQKEWANIVKHGIDFSTATVVFLDENTFDSEDERDYGEQRWNTIGMVDGRLLHVTYTERGDVTRIISARLAEPHERRTYYRAIQTRSK